MKQTLLTMTAVIALAGLAASPAPAQERKAAPAPSAKEEAPPKAQRSPVNEWIDAENALIDPLNDLDKESIFIMRNKYSTIRAIEVAERDIGNAVASCGKENPQIKKTMNDRFTQWKNAVHPVIETAKTNLTREIEQQSIVDTAQLKHVLKLNDAAYKFSESQTTKEVITTREACQGLLNSMDQTEDQMITLLQQILLPESVIRKRTYVRPPSDKKNFSKETPKAAE